MTADEPVRPGATGDTDDPEVLAAELAEELAAAAAEPPPKKRWWRLPLRIVVSLAMLWFLITKIAGVSLRDLVPEWSPAATAWLALAFVLTAVSVVLSALRWQEVLHGMGIRSRLGPLISHYFACQYVSNVLPTTIGGDVLRVSRESKDSGDTADSFASVIIERLTGWLVLPVLTFAGFLLNPSLRQGDHPTTDTVLTAEQAANLALAIAGGTLLALIVVLYMADHPRLGGRFASREGWRRWIGAVHLGVSRLRHQPGVTARVIAVGLAFQFVLVLAGTAAAHTIGIEGVGLTVMLAFLPPVLISQIVPIGITGLGVREGMLVILLAPLGVPRQQAIALGLLLFLLNLVVGLLGAPSFVMGSREKKPAT